MPGHEPEANTGRDADPETQRKILLRALFDGTVAITALTALLFLLGTVYLGAFLRDIWGRFLEPRHAYVRSTRLFFPGPGPVVCPDYPGTSFICIRIIRFYRDRKRWIQKSFTWRPRNGFF